MALTDPQSVTVNAVATDLNRISAEKSRSVYAVSDGSLKLTVSHQDSNKRSRRMVRLDQRVVATDPLSSESEYKTLGAYLVIDQPEYGFTDAEIDYVVQALNDWATSANIAKVLGSQH